MRKLLASTLLILAVACGSDPDDGVVPTSYGDVLDMLGRAGSMQAMRARQPQLLAMGVDGLPALRLALTTSQGMLEEGAAGRLDWSDPEQVFYASDLGDFDRMGVVLREVIDQLGPDEEPTCGMCRGTGRTPFGACMGC